MLKTSVNCYDYKANPANLFGHGGPRAVRCGRDAKYAIKMGEKDANTINGFRPVCEICKSQYAGWTVIKIEDANLTPQPN